MLRSLALAGLVFSSVVAQSQEITLANGEWAPYLSEDLKHAGYMSHIVSEAFKEEGITVKYVFLPWKRGFEDAKDGKYEGSLIWGYNEDRAKDFYYSEPVADLGTSLFYQTGKGIDWSKPEDLAKYKIGGVIGYAYGIEELEKQGVVKVERIGKDVNNYKKLAAGRLDIVLEDTEVGHETVSKLGLSDKITAHPKTLKSRKYSVIFSKKIPNAEQLMEAFNRGLAKIKADGRYQQFLDASRRGEYKK
ncbi:substrate-binding periplasmic protein [Litoribrevibacter albus]|uniref:Amino acid ABC transporter substrate-binding protein n=1 Tax=Litoribrevibacter albus TaxID=1473156 RepID=A0AA37S988_9GAMM|nr:transporter substrate-binding domain-containing protein [Litoribrevibacter albus]GLQ31762.1 amino acid ABC transporter substrate-binding protein [Litoribrevibacter albus]